MMVWQAPSGLRGALAKGSYTRGGFAEAPGAAGGDLTLGGGWARPRLEVGRRAFGLRAQRSGLPAQAEAGPGLNWGTSESTHNKMDRGGRPCRAWTQGKPGEERKELGNVVSIPLQLTEKAGEEAGSQNSGSVTQGGDVCTEETRDGQRPVSMPSSPPLHTPQYTHTHPTAHVHTHKNIQAPHTYIHTSHHTHTPYCTRTYTQKHTSTTHIRIHNTPHTHTPYCTRTYTQKHTSTTHICIHNTPHT